MTEETILATLVKSPPDLERMNAHNWHGTCHGGDMNPAQSGPYASRRECRSKGSTRPAHHSSRGLRSAAPGRNSAIVLLEDLGRRSSRRSAVPDARVQRRSRTGRRASSRTGSTQTTSSGRPPGSRAGTSGWAPGSETADVHRAIAEEAGRTGTADRRGGLLSAAVCYHFAKFVWVVDVERNQETTLHASDCLYRAHRLARSVGRARRDPVRRRGPRRQPQARAAADGRRSCSSCRASTPPRRSSSAGRTSSFARPRHVFPGRAGPGRERLRDPHPAGLRGAVTAGLDALAGQTTRPRPVGAAGVSLAGYYAPRAAAPEPRVRAVAGVSGPYNFGECWEGLPALTRETFHHHSGARDEDEARANAQELDLAPVIGGLERPGLMVTGRLDRVIPWEQTKRIADEAPATRFVLYEEGNHVCNNIPYKYRPLVADWLRKELANRCGIGLRRPRWRVGTRSRESSWTNTSSRRSSSSATRA